MKSLKLLLGLLAAASLVGCAKDKGDSSSSYGYNYVGDGGILYIPPTTGGGSSGLPGINWDYGGSASLSPTAKFTDGFYNGRDLSQATDVKVNLNLKKYGNGYGGVVTIAYTLGGQRYEDQFTSLMNEKHWYGTGTIMTNEENNRYNVWLNSAKTQWHGFFQDNYGSVVVVIDHVEDTGDGEILGVSGRVYVMNFTTNFATAPTSPTSCWFVVRGPYDCRTWKTGQNSDGNGGAVNTYKALYPYVENSTGGTTGAPKPVGYYSIGTFSGLQIEGAFND